jgi:tetratricopeptide (TPR) repeat protein
MLTEEALIFLAGLGACGLVVLGVLELLWPARPKHPRRRRPPVPAPVPARHRSPERARTRHAREPGAPRYVARAATTAPSVPPRSRPVPARPDDLSPVVEACVALHNERRYEEAVLRGTAALSDGPTSVRPSVDADGAAALWSVVGLSKQALGDNEGARDALEAAIVAATALERPTYQRQLGRLAAGVAEEFLARARAVASPDAEERLALIREATAWVRRGQAATPEDSDLLALAARTQEALWPVWEQVVMGQVQRQRFREARRLLRAALEDPDFPPARKDQFQELLSGTFSGEIGQLTAQAIRSVQELRETEALGSLERAEELLSRVHDEALPPKRREEVDRRLWWGYNRLGLRRVESGEFADAIEPLFRALRLSPVGTERHADTRALLARALEGLVDARALEIRHLAEDGDREAAVVETDKLWTRLAGARGRGLDEQDLAVATAMVRRLFEELGLARD